MNKPKIIDGDDDSYTRINKRFYGGKYWLNLDGDYHREGNLPAVIYYDGSLSYRINGKPY